MKEMVRKIRTGGYLNIRAVIPTYNERANFGAIVSSFFAELPELNVLIVDDNSPDGTSDAVISLLADGESPKHRMRRRPMRARIEGPGTWSGDRGVPFFQLKLYEPIFEAHCRKAAN
jgi:dolichol-phosphate mannosyltransferase